MMVTLDLPNEGNIKVCGFDTVNHPNEVRKKVGWMPDSYGAYDSMDVWEYMDFFGRAYGYSGKELDLRVGEVMEFTELNPLKDRPVKHLSKGQKQRLCLARTLVPDPEVLVLDEPAAGLDPRARIDVKNLVRVLAEEKKTLFISSHILSELEQMCDALLFINKGRIVHQGSSDSLKGKEGETAHLRIRFSREVDLREWCSFQQGVEFLEQDKAGARVRIENATLDSLHALLKKLIEQDLPVCGYFREEVRLEDAFVDLLNTTEGKA